MSPTLSLHLMVRNLPPGQRRPKIAQAIGERARDACSGYCWNAPCACPIAVSAPASSGSTTIWTAICRRWRWHWLEPDEPAGRRPRRAHAAYRGAGVGGKRGGTADSPRLPGAGRRLPGSGLHRPAATRRCWGRWSGAATRCSARTRVDPLLFESMPWGGDRLLALTRERLRQLGWEHHLLPALWDVDRPRTCRAWRRWGWSCETQNSSSSRSAPR